MAATRTLAELYRQTIPCGVWQDGTELLIVFESERESCGIVWYDAKGKEKERISFKEKHRQGKGYVMTLPAKKYKKYQYLFFEGDKLVPDVHAKALAVPASYGEQWSVTDLKAGIPENDFDWGEDFFPRLAYKDCVVYLAHVRGFTAHSSSEVKHKGTFDGIREKIPYLKELGITTLELQPAYEFPEYPLQEEYEELSKSSYYLPEDGKCASKLLNYWGYKTGYYFLPKKAYSKGNPTQELKELVKELHGNQMELVMQFYFPTEIKRKDIPFILQYWVEEYHVDGFRLMGMNLPVVQIAELEALRDTKFWYENPEELLRAESIRTNCTNWARYNSEYLYAMRKWLKGDEDMLDTCLQHMRRVPMNYAQINYFTNYSGFTLMDLVSYDRKHNEANGEENRDGDNYNCSWNCGEEGMTRKRKVQQLRIRQMKNAMMLLLFSQSTPLIFMGDEFGNSQSGNNNPYCQDNETTWLDWKLLTKHQKFYQFFKEMVTFRKAHPVLHPQSQATGMDYRGCGYPDLSYHGEKAWKPDRAYDKRHIGVLYYEQDGENSKASNFYYLAINLHWQEHQLALPLLPKGLKWQLMVTTGQVKADEKVGECITLEGRSISLYASIKEKKVRK